MGDPKNGDQLSLLHHSKDTAEPAAIDKNQTKADNSQPSNSNNTATSSSLDKPQSLPSIAQPVASGLKGLSRLSEHRPALKHRPTKNRPSLWYALYFPQLSDLNELQQKETLTALAAVAESISSTVSFHPLGLVCEIRSSLNYFGGIDSLHNKVKHRMAQKLEKLNQPSTFFYAASPTVSGSLMLARSGQNTLVYQKDNLRSALGKLTVDILELDQEQSRRLHNMGIRTLRDIWRLPADGLRKRFGSEFVSQLDKALGIAKEPTRNYLPPPSFNSSYDLPYELENLDCLLPVIDEIITQLCDFLTRRDLSTSRLVFSLLHEKQSLTTVDISLRQPSRSSNHFLLLVETYFHNLIIPAPVIAVSLSVDQFDAFTSYTEELLLDGKPDPKQRASNLNQFMEQLKARLGDNHLKSIACAAEHCPEKASTMLEYNSQSNIDISEQKYQTKYVANRPRPLWLLDEPEQLTEKNGRLYHSKPVSIISGPERIETDWWAGHDVRRDYYIAQEANGSRLWIYRERSGERRWLLHGYFS